jgi:predicted methyltransferase
LRQDDEWEQVFTKIFRSLKPHGSFWISDLVIHEHPGIQAPLWSAYETYIIKHLGLEARDAIFAKIEDEDTPRSVTVRRVTVYANCLHRRLREAVNSPSNPFNSGERETGR